ncbi:MAG: hypothetical protein AAB529_01255 [Patescibacteria group bacterium]
MNQKINRKFILPVLSVILLLLIAVFFVSVNKTNSVSLNAGLSDFFSKVLGPIFKPPTTSQSSSSSKVGSPIPVPKTGGSYCSKEENKGPDGKTYIKYTCVPALTSSRQCNNNNDCYVYKHALCFKDKCYVEGGVALSDCVNDSDCAEKKYNTCENSGRGFVCTSNSGFGTNECSTNSDCEINHTYTVCLPIAPLPGSTVNWVCARALGKANNQCQKAEDCENVVLPSNLK